MTDPYVDLLLVAAAVIPPLAVATARRRCGRVVFAAPWLALAALARAASGGDPVLPAALALAAAMPLWWLGWRAAAGRVLDLGHARWHALWIAVPPINLVWVGWLLTKTTAAGPDDSGAGREDHAAAIRPTAAARGSGPRSADATRTAP